MTSRLCNHAEFWSTITDIQNTINNTGLIIWYEIRPIETGVELLGQALNIQNITRKRIPTTS
jgi:hypothetical protein